MQDGQRGGPVEREVGTLEIAPLLVVDGLVHHLRVPEPVHRLVDYLRNPVDHPDPSVLQDHPRYNVSTAAGR